MNRIIFVSFMFFIFWAAITPGGAITVTNTLTSTHTLTFTPTVTSTITQTPCNTPVGYVDPKNPGDSYINYMGYQKIYFPTVTYVDGVWVYGSSTNAPVPIKVGLYSDIGGAPGTLLVSSNPQIKIQGWQYVPFLPLLVIPGNYWMGVFMNDQRWMISNGSLFFKGPGQMPSKPVSLSYGGEYDIGVYADTCGDTVSTLTPTFTYTFTPSPTVTSTPASDGVNLNMPLNVGGGKTCNTPTNTPTWNSTPRQTPSAPVSQAVIYFGDSILGYCQPTPFPGYVNAYLNAIYPVTKGLEFWDPGDTSQKYVDQKIGYNLTSIWTQNVGPMTRCVMALGFSNEISNFNAKTCDSCVDNQSVSVGISLSYVYKGEMQKIISDIVSFQPNVKLVICTLPDPNNNGAGPYFSFCPQMVKVAFNQRIFELAHDNNLRVADLYTALMGCTSCYGTTCDNLHPSQKGDLLIAQTIEAQFSNW